jgi:hypothetical protein
MRRLVGPVAAATVVVVVAGVALLIGNARGGPAANAASAGKHAPPATKTAKVTKRDLAETQDVSGTLGYGDTRDVAFGGRGTITALPAVGTVVDRGGQLGEVDGKPIALFFGDRPMWRDLGPGVTDGADVAQLEANLVALGHGTHAALGENYTWTDATTDAVKHWQHATGRAETGVVALGDVVFQTGAVRIAQHAANVGANAGGPALKVTGTARQITIDVPAAYQSLVKVDQAVQVSLPDESKAAAKITSVGTVAQAAQQGQDPTIPVVATLTDQTVGAGLDQAPVTVHLVTNQATGVLAVPVGALLALTEGGYAVETVTGPGTTKLVGVQLGTFADGWVQVTGNVHEGDQVVTAE